MPTALSNGINLYYEIHGQGDPILLIDGLGYDMWMWHRMIPTLAERFQVIAFDNRGVGKSDKPAGPYSAQMLADDAAGLLEALGVGRATVAGHSMGGFVAQALALSRPDLISKLILMATNFGGPNHIPVTPEAMAVLTEVNIDPMERLRRGIAIACAPGFEEKEPTFFEEWVNFRAQNPMSPEAYQSQLAIGMALFAAEAAFEDKLKNVEAPTLILFGEHDRVVPPGNADLLASVIPNSEVVILPGTGHVFPLETPEAAAAAIMDFMAT